ncbi:hypothetical protein HHI36_014975 [Cryptolaemus montrouzieri]|uniref:Uncharacterized protein n=1 Tax=Cryptolaemus montrouzieri TaxID=559131 RepID=A0ABD2N515_9CUCU
MAGSSELFLELSKLRKDISMGLLINKSVPEDIIVQEDVRKLIESNKNGVSSEKNQNVEKANDPATNENFMRLQFEHKSAKLELNYSESIIKQLERTVSDKENIIFLLNQNIKLTSTKNQFPEERSVATPNQNFLISTQLVPRPPKVGSSRDNSKRPDIDTGHNVNMIHKSDIVPRSTTAEIEKILGMKASKQLREKAMS